MSESDASSCPTVPIADGLLVRVTGDLDFLRSPEVRQALVAAAQQGPPRLVIDMTQVGYIDSSGLAALIEAERVQHRRQAKTVLCGLTSPVRGIIAVARLDHIFLIADTPAAALQA